MIVNQASDWSEAVADRFAFGLGAAQITRVAIRDLLRRSGDPSTVEQRGESPASRAPAYSLPPGDRRCQSLHRSQAHLIACCVESGLGRWKFPRARRRRPAPSVAGAIGITHPIQAVQGCLASLKRRQASGPVQSLKFKVTWRFGGFTCECAVAPPIA